MSPSHQMPQCCANADRLIAPATSDVKVPTVALTSVLTTAAPTTSAITSRTRSSAVRNPNRRRSHHPRSASAVFPTAIATAAPAGIDVVRFAISAPANTATHISGPNSRSAASAIPVGGHTGVALPCATDSESPTLAETT
jgi:hypothetical protein